MTTSSGIYGYCKLFVRTEQREFVVRLLGSLLGITPAGFYLTHDALGFDVRTNPDAVIGSRDFLDWPVIVEVTNDTRSEGVVRVLGDLLRASWADGVPMVAACPFEDELPWSGGIAYE